MEYPPQLEIKYDESEEPGFAKVYMAPSKKEVGGQWVPDPSKPKKAKARVNNQIAVVFHYRDAYRNREGQYPVYAHGAMVAWRATIGSYDPATRVFTPASDGDFKGEVSFIDNTKSKNGDHWVTDRIRRLIEENVGAGDVKSHAFLFGKKPSTTANPSFFVEYLGPVANAGGEQPAPQDDLLPPQEDALDLTPVESQIIERVRSNLVGRGKTLTQFAKERSSSPSEILYTLFTSGTIKGDKGEMIKLPEARARQLAKNVATLTLPM